MRPSIINHIVSHPPEAGHRIFFCRLDGVEVLELRELYARAGRLALVLRRLGIGRNDRIGILAANTLEWVLLDLAALRLGAVTVGFDPGKFEVERGLSARYGLRLFFTDRRVDVFGSRPIGEVRQLAAQSAAGETLRPMRYARDDVSALKLTSGSTGVPKALTASVGSIDSALHAVQDMFAHRTADNLFVFLPLSVQQQRYWIYSALRFGHDVTVSTYQAAFPAMGRVQPTVVMGVPAFFESARAHIAAQAQAQALGAGPEAAGGREVARAAARQLFGSRIRYLWTGSAPAGAEMLRFFTDIGLPIFEGYGLNETDIVSKNHPGASRAGSVGRVLPGKQVLLDGHGVISVRSDQPVTNGYEYAPPGESERVFRKHGIVQTGDLGYLDQDGFLFIRGRADDAIVLDNGRKIIVRPIEERMKASPAIEECVLFCPTDTHLVAVVSPSQEPADEAAIAAHLALTNSKLGRDEQIHRVVVARSRFSVENDLLTSQLKPKRKRILETFCLEIHDNRRGILAH
jgi:long-subunit acyl-CoA synthetase (AMP-forming)